MHCCMNNKVILVPLIMYFQALMPLNVQVIFKNMKLQVKQLIKL